MYSVGAIKPLEKSHDSVWEEVSSQSKDRASRVEVLSIQASSDVDPCSASETRFSLRTSIAVILSISLFLWYWLFQLGYYLVGIFV
ncbi:MAG: hypothetical protein ACRED0_05830 [Gammaproteobacteria bacterium]